MSDNGLQSVLPQYYAPAISSHMLPSVILPDHAPATIYKDQVEALAARIYSDGALGDADPGRTVVNIMLPRGVVLMDGFSPGFQPPAGTEAEHERRLHGVVKVDDEKTPTPGTAWAGTTDRRMSAARHGRLLRRRRVLRGRQRHSRLQPALEERGGDVLPRAQRGPDRPGRGRRHQDRRQLQARLVLGAEGGEIGDIPVKEAGASLSLVFNEIELADGSGAVPVQLMWSNKDNGPASHMD